MRYIDDIESLEALYGPASPTSIAKETDHVTADYARLIAASPFVALATVGPEGLDCTPRGDAPGFVRVVDPKTLMLPDRRGNNRIDSLRNVVRDPRAALMFLIPGAGVCLRVNGRARVCVAPDLLDSFAMEGKPPRSVLALAVEAVYFQCSRAVMRAALWNPASHVAADAIPTAGQILAGLKPDVDADAYDRDWPARAKAGLW